MAMSDKERKQLLGLLIVLPFLVAGAFWVYVWQPRAAEAAEMRQTMDSLQADVDSAKQDFASGMTVEDLRRRNADYAASLALMRELVPTDNEVATLINDISDRAKLRNVHLADLTPSGYEEGEHFRVGQWRFVVVGRYDDIGGFLSDIASLSRIMVPSQLSLQQDRSALSLGDTTGALLQATFQLRTFVKRRQSGAEDGGGAGGP